MFELETCESFCESNCPEVKSVPTYLSAYLCLSKRESVIDKRESEREMEQSEIDRQRRERTRSLSYTMMLISFFLKHNSSLISGCKKR